MTRKSMRDRGYNAKGDLFVGTDDDVAVRLPVGTDGQVLTADSSTSTGLAWKAGVEALDWQESVLDKDLSTPPGAPTTGDRYIVAAPGADGWAGHDNDIAEYDGTNWDFYTPDAGTATYVEDEEVIYLYTGSAWVQFASGWYSYYTDAVIHTLDVLGDARLLVPLAENSGAIVTDKTYRGYDGTFLAPDIAPFSGFAGRALRYIDSNDPLARAAFADQDEFTFYDGASEKAFSIFATINLAYGLGAWNMAVLSKWDVASGGEAREWLLAVDTSGKPFLTLYDETNNDSFTCTSDVAINDGYWHVVAFTYDGSSDVTGITPYIDGLYVAHTDTPDGGAYAHMINTATDVMLGCVIDTGTSTITNLYYGYVSWVGLTGKEMSPEEVWLMSNRILALAGNNI